jgi:hypothetical protein
MMNSASGRRVPGRDADAGDGEPRREKRERQRGSRADE